MQTTRTQCWCPQGPSSSPTGPSASHKQMWPKEGDIQELLGGAEGDQSELRVGGTLQTRGIPLSPCLVLVGCHKAMEVGVSWMGFFML